MSFYLIILSKFKNLRLNKYSLIILSLFLFISIDASSQKVKIIELTGKIISEKDNSPVHYAAVINIKKGKAVACDSLGYFHMTMLSDDILRINALGFERKYFSLKDTNINTNEILILKLKEKTYKLSNVDIFEARWNDFEFDFIHTETEKQETKERIEKWFYTLIDPKELALITASTAIGIPINFKTKIDKQKIKVEELKKIDLENKIIELKYNPELISEITGLNEPEAIKFMRYCDFDRNFLLSVNDYDLIVLINVKFESYYSHIHR